MDRQTAAVALQLLQRMTITGAEVNAFLAVTKAVADIAAGTMVVVPARTEDGPATPHV